jgi:hypothetical protein
MVTPTHLNVAFLRTLAVLFDTQSVVKVHRKYRKCFSVFHVAAGISKISLVQELFLGGGG